MESNQSVFEKFEIVKSELYRFIGSSVYIGNKAPGTWPENNKKMFGVHDSLWEQSGWIFKELDALSEYASDEPHNAALIVWDKYDNKNELYGYYIGRFMKAGTPVPKGLDYYDVTAENVAKGWRKGKLGDRFGNMLVYAEEFLTDEIGRSDYIVNPGSNSYFMAEIYPNPDENGESYVGVYLACELKKSDGSGTVMTGSSSNANPDLANYMSVKQQEEFLFLGKIYAEEKMNFGKWYEDFSKIGGFEKIAPYRRNTDEVSETIHAITLKPQKFTAGIGIVADGAIKAPEGYEFKKIPSGECLVVTSEWMPTNDEAHKSLDEAEKNKKMPEGYVDDDQSIYTVIEKFYESPEKGHRWERWYPIKKVD